jgi:hypothetical protein
MLSRLRILVIGFKLLDGNKQFRPSCYAKICEKPKITEESLEMRTLIVNIFGMRELTSRSVY